MKSTTLFALFLLSAFTSYLPSATTAFVLDTDGDPLLNGGTYYVLPVIRGKGGGIELAKTGNETCPLTVVQSPLDKGLPTRISSPYRILYIYEGLPLNIQFTVVPLCASTPSKWTIVEGLLEGPAVKITGYANTVAGWFSIEKASLDYNDYKLVFSEIDGSISGYIGIHIDSEGNRQLVVTKNDPLLVHFQKVESSTI
ncbi:Kunitz-type trypsin inhibitor KTI1 [Spatholobus suberectus]|nr:Kunitz-type trypsin inhibitor KTI1 [Spatholobus suberectus]